MRVRAGLILLLIAVLGPVAVILAMPMALIVWIIGRD